MIRIITDSHYSFGFGLCWRFKRAFGFIEIRFGHHDYRHYIYGG